MTDLTTTAAPPVGAATDHQQARGTGGRDGAGAPHAAGAHTTGEHHDGI